MIMDRSLVLAEGNLGSDQALTPEGFLFCRNVPIARIGTQQYLAEELPELEAGRDGILHVERRPEDVFREETIRSFEGKPIVGNEEEEHPEEPIGPHNYKRYTVGTILNPRRGDVALNDFLIADLLIKDADAIAAVRAGKREVSCGYDADYEQQGPGKARQVNIIGNHLALVKRGRCGSRCSIGDQDMAETQKKTLFERAMDALRSGGETAMKAVLTSDSEMGGAASGGVHVHLHGGPNGSTTMAPTADEDEKEDKEKKTDDGEMPPWFKKHSEDMAGWRGGMDSFRKEVSDWMKARDAGPAEEKEDEEVAVEEAEGESEGDVISLDAGAEEEEEEAEQMEDKKPKMKDKKKVKDSAAVLASKQLFRDIASGAEILSPGIKLPTFDAITGPKLVEQMCVLKRRALAAHAHTKDGAASIGQITGARTLNLKSMDCAAVGLLFNGAVAFAKDRNSRQEIDLGKGQPRHQTTDFQPPKSVSDFNQTKNAFWAKQKAH